MIAALPFVIAFALDLIIGSPSEIDLFALIGRLLPKLYARLAEKKTPDRAMSSLVTIVMLSAFLVPLIIVGVGYLIFPAIGAILEGILLYFAIDAKKLFDDCMVLYGYLKDGYYNEARDRLSMMTPRDTYALDPEGVDAAAVETAADKTETDVLHPLFWMCIGGAPLAFSYKCAALLDDMMKKEGKEFSLYRTLDSIPGFMRAFVIPAAALVKCDPKGAGAILKRDGKKNPGYRTGILAAFSGALGVQTGGDISEGGVVTHRERIGDAAMEIDGEDMKRSGLLMYATAGIALVAAFAVRALAGTLLGIILP